MKKNRWLFLWFFSGIFLPGYSQHTKDTRQYIDHWIRITIREAETDTANSYRYVLNGILLTDTEELPYLPKEKITSISYLGRDQILAPGVTSCTPPRPIVSISTRKDNRKYREKILRTLHEIPLSQQPALCINGQVIREDVWTDCLAHLRAAHIFTITYIRKPVYTERYGAAGENGLVCIQMKKTLPSLKNLMKDATHP